MCKGFATSNLNLQERQHQYPVIVHGYGKHVKGFVISLTYDNEILMYLIHLCIISDVPISVSTLHSPDKALVR